MSTTTHQYQEVYKAISGMEISQFTGEEPIEVHLEDVLRAIGEERIIKYDHAHSISANISLSMGGVFMNENGMHLATYNLSLPFSEQSEELYQFLHEILCK
jgi:hypothetical protein